MAVIKDMHTGQAMAFRRNLRAWLKTLPKDAPYRDTLVNAHNAMLALEKANNRLWNEVIEQEGEW